MQSSSIDLAALQGHKSRPTLELLYHNALRFGQRHVGLEFAIFGSGAISHIAPHARG